MVLYKLALVLNHDYVIDHKNCRYPQTENFYSNLIQFSQQIITIETIFI